MRLEEGSGMRLEEGNGESDSAVRVKKKTTMAHYH